MRKRLPAFARERWSIEARHPPRPGGCSRTVLDRDERRERARAEHDGTRAEAASYARPWRRTIGASQTRRDGAGAPELLARTLEDRHRRGAQETRDRPGAARSRAGGGIAGGHPRAIGTAVRNTGAGASPGRDCPLADCRR